MNPRHTAIGIKQVIRCEWMDHTAHLLLAGLDAPAIRHELHTWLAERTSTGAEGQRSVQTRTFVVNNLMRIWVAPDAELLAFREASLAFLRDNPALALPIHWGMIAAVYPFWFNVARQTGRLLALQDQVTQMQIITRLKEQYGDRQTVSRYARFVIRSLVAWGVLKDTATKGCYEKAAPASITDPRLVSLLLESALLATPENRIALRLLLNHPACFPFQLPPMTGDSVAQHNHRIEVVRSGSDEDLLQLR